MRGREETRRLLQIGLGQAQRRKQAVRRMRLARIQNRCTTGGPLASPWGLAQAPSSFGAFSNDLLIANFNDDNGNINAFDPITGDFVGSLRLENGALVSLPDLWSIAFGNGALAGPLNTLVFTAGIGDEDHGLFGSLTAVPEPAMLGMFGAAIAVLAVARRRRAAG
jgi:hypothetical protein